MTHDQTTPASVEVTQADREAAQALMDRWEFGDLHCDDFVEAFARHRLAHSAPAGEVEPVAWMYRWKADGEYVNWRYSDASNYHKSLDGYEEKPLYTHPAPPADLVELVEALREAREALVDHNDCLRSAHSVASRDGAETNWLTFRGAVTYTLAEHHETVKAARVTLAKHGGA